MYFRIFFHFYGVVQTLTMFWFIYMKNFEQFRLNFEKDKAKSSNYEEKTYSTKKEKKKKEKNNNICVVLTLKKSHFLLTI